MPNNYYSFNEFTMWIFDIFSVAFEHFSNPKKRVFIGYIFLSICIAFLWLVLLKKISIKDAFWRVFDKRVFFAKSSQSDYLVFLLNRGFTFFVSPLLISQIAIATIIFHFLHRIIPFFTFINKFIFCVIKNHQLG